MVAKGAVVTQSDNGLFDCVVREPVVRQVEVNHDLRPEQLLRALEENGFTLSLHWPEAVHHIQFENAGRLNFRSRVELISPGFRLGDRALDGFLAGRRLEMSGVRSALALFMTEPDLARRYPTCIRWRAKGRWALLILREEGRQITAHLTGKGFSEYEPDLWFPGSPISS